MVLEILNRQSKLHCHMSQLIKELVAWQHLNHLLNLDEIQIIIDDLSSPVYVSPRIVDTLKSGSECRLSLSLNVSLSLGDQWPPDQGNFEGSYQKIPRLT